MLDVHRKDALDERAEKYAIRVNCTLYVLLSSAYRVFFRFDSLTS